MDALLMDEDAMEYYHRMGVYPNFFFLILRYVKKLIGLLYENAQDHEYRVKKALDKQIRVLEK
jgi:hypothetical protein